LLAETPPDFAHVVHVQLFQYPLRIVVG